MTMFSSENLAAFYKQALAYLPKVGLAILTLIIGFWIIGIITRALRNLLQRHKFDQTLSNFLTSLANVGMKVMLLLSVASQFGVDTTSFVAILSALTLGIGMALNGSIGHFASGVMLMIFKPFKVGDLVTIGGGHTGTVDAINVFNTTLRTLDNKLIIVANSNVTGNTITNISGQGIIGVELTFNIGHSASIDKAREIILRVGKECPDVLDVPEQGVVVGAIQDHCVTLNSRPFCNSEKYWDTLFYMNEHVKKAFVKEGIAGPLPRMSVDLPSKN
jgi:small conductance mechanosensitive channel